MLKLSNYYCGKKGELKSIENFENLKNSRILPHLLAPCYSMYFIQKIGSTFVNKV